MIVNNACIIRIIREAPCIRDEFRLAIPSHEGTWRAEASISAIILSTSDIPPVALSLPLPRTWAHIHGDCVSEHIPALQCDSNATVS